MRSKLLRHPPQRRGVIARQRPCLLLLVNNLQITGPGLSHEIIKRVAARAKATVACILQKQKVDAAGLLMALSTGKGRGGVNGSVDTLSRRHRKRMTRLSISIVAPMSPGPHFFWRPV